MHFVPKYRDLCLITIVLIILKLSGDLTWSWYMVTFLVWFPVAAIVGGVFLFWLFIRYVQATE